MPTPSRDEVLAHVDLTGCSAADAARHFGIQPGTIRVWLSRRRNGATTVTAGPAKKGAKKARRESTTSPPTVARARTPVDDLPTDDRARLVDEARGLIRSAAATRVRLDRTVADENAKPGMIAAVSSALANTMRALSDLVRAYPGLLEAAEAKVERDDDAIAKRTAETYGVTPVEPPTE